MKKKGNKKVPNCVPVKEQSSSATRYTERPMYEKDERPVPADSAERGIYEKNDKQPPLANVKPDATNSSIPVDAMNEKFKGRLLKLREQRLNENPLARIGGTIASWAAKKAIGAALGTDDNKQNEPSASEKISAEKKLGGKRQTSPVKTKSSWNTSRSSSDAVAQSKLRTADLKTAKQITTPQQTQKVQENKIIDIRKMIKENVDNMNLHINGRQITLNTTMAKRILEVYDSVNTKNKKIVEGMLNEDLESFKKLLNFSIRN
jgi:hypothetical protein